MSQQKDDLMQIAAFLQTVEENPALQREVEAVISDTKCAGDVADIAARHGYAFSLETFLAALDEAKLPAAGSGQREVDLDDAQLDTVAGGGMFASMLNDPKNVDMFRGLKSIAAGLSCCGECLEERQRREAVTPA